MKKKITKVNEIILTVIFIPIVILFLLGLLIITPFDYLKYKRSLYYKDTKEKYSWLCFSSYYIKFYDLVKKADLPIDYYRCAYLPITGYGFFVYKDMLIIVDYDLCYDEEKNIWTVEIEDEYVDVKEDVVNAIDRCNKLLKSNVCNEAIILIDKDLFEEHPKVEYKNIKFLPISNDLDVEAIKTLII